MKKIVFLLGFVFAASVSEASYLLWQVVGEENPTDNQLAGISGDGWKYAKFYQVKDGEKSAAPVASMVNYEDGDTKDGAGPMAVNLGTITSYSQLSAYSYYIELLNSSSQLVGYLQGSYTEFATSGSITYSDTLDPVELGSLTPWHGGSYSAPEPTSGLLMLLGAAVLGLRRKQRKTEE